MRGYFSTLMVGGALYMVGGATSFSWTAFLPKELNNSFSVTNEIWRSLDRGANWTLWSSAPGFAARAGQCTLAINGVFHLYGGFDATSQRTDRWTSTDGLTWTNVGNSGSFAPDASRTNWIENCASHASQLYASFDCSTWRKSLGTQLGHFDAAGNWFDDGLFPVAEALNQRRFEPGLTSDSAACIWLAEGVAQAVVPSAAATSGDAERAARTRKSGCVGPVLPVNRRRQAPHRSPATRRAPPRQYRHPNCWAPPPRAG